MREILFRGKSDITGTWYEGFAFQIVGGLWFIREKPPVSDHRVDPETIGQYTGLVDAASVRIFEGDVLKFAPVTFGDWSTAPAEYAVVVWGDGGWELEYTGNIGPEVLDASTANAAVIVGNIHDNPGLVGRA